LQDEEKIRVSAEYPTDVFSLQQPPVWGWSKLVLSYQQLATSTAYYQVYESNESGKTSLVTFDTTICTSYQSFSARTGQDALISCHAAYRRQKNKAKPPRAPELPGVSLQFDSQSTDLDPKASRANGTNATC